MEIERDEMEVGVLFVGAGPANLAGAIRLVDQVEAYNEKIEAGEIEGEQIDLEEESIMIIEKGAEIGDQILSGAVVDTKAFFDLFDEEFLNENPPPFDIACHKDGLVLMTPPKDENLTKRGFLDAFTGDDCVIHAPIIPPTFQNEGNYVASLSEVVKWLAEIAEEKGVMIMPEFPGADLLMEDGKVIGVRTGDKGVDKHGEQKGNFEPGTDIHAKLVILGEGARGSLTKKLIKTFDLTRDSNHQIYSTGVKELWNIKPGKVEPGEVIHTAGYPLDGDTFGGGWIYGMTNNRVSIGLVSALDSPDPYLDPHRKFNEWKTHPFLANILEDGELIKYGAKTIPEGGWFSLPQPYAPGALLVGDSAGFVNISRLKGIHLSMKSGMLAAETAFEILTNGGDASIEMTKKYYERILGSWIFDELWSVRNFRQAFQTNIFGLPGMISGTLLTGSGFAVASVLGLVGVICLLAGATAFGCVLVLLAGVTFTASFPLGTFPLGRMETLSDHERMRKINIGGWSRKTSDSDPIPDWREPSVSAAADQVKHDSNRDIAKAPASPLDANAPAASVVGKGQIMDKVTSVYHSGSVHEEDQPPHLIVADTEICHTRCAEEYGNPCQYFCPASVYEMVETDGGRNRELMLNFSNCVHCKTCDIRDPYQIITWVPPEGGGGPSYQGL